MGGLVAPHSKPCKKNWDKNLINRPGLLMHTKCQLWATLLDISDSSFNFNNNPDQDLSTDSNLAQKISITFLVPSNQAVADNTERYILVVTLTSIVQSQHPNHSTVILKQQGHLSCHFPFLETKPKKKNTNNVMSRVKPCSNSHDSWCYPVPLITIDYHVCVQMVQVTVVSDRWQNHETYP